MSALGIAALVVVVVLVGALCAPTVPPLWAVVGSPAGGQAAGASQELIVCGGDEVYILDLAREDNGKPKKVWSWRAKDCLELPAELKQWQFASTDECKPVGGGKWILITSSGSGVALVERGTGRASFWAVAENAHSADLLPGGRVAVATSGHEGSGPPRNCDQLIIYDANTSEKELFSTALPEGHGVVWDEARGVLWALAHRDIRAYRLVDWDSGNPSLAMFFIVDLPEGGGHDLYPVPDSPLMTVTTGSHCWLFDRDKRSFKLHPQLRETGHVNSISTNPVTGQIAYVQGEGEKWWAERVLLMQPDRVVDLAGERVYKGRWGTPVH